jgi:hypothetical protein
MKNKLANADHQLMQSFKYRTTPTPAPAKVEEPKAPALPAAVDHVVCAALHLADIVMTPRQRDLADRIYELACALEYTYIYPEEG